MDRNNRVLIDRLLPHRRLAGSEARHSERLVEAVRMDERGLMWVEWWASRPDYHHDLLTENEYRKQVMALVAEVRRLREWLERVKQVEGADDAGGGVWMCALRAQAALDGKPVPKDGGYDDSIDG